jgi:hypothetical protein
MAISHVIKRGYGTVNALVTRGYGAFAGLVSNPPPGRIDQSLGSRPVHTSKGSVQ